MKLPSLNNRNRFRIMVYGGLFLLIVYSVMIEPEWILIRKIALSPNPQYILVHISDIHYKGNDSCLNRVISRINKMSPDFVCFTGDLVDEKRDLKDALNILEKLRCPIFGVPGNHEYWSGVSFEDIEKTFKNTGGSWLVNRRIRFGNIEITGMADEEYRRTETDENNLPDRTLLLTHYPAMVNQISGSKYDLILAGHSHGGQIRLPVLGAVKLPYAVDRYDKGLFKTEAGILYVNPGIGTYGIPVRFFCRPEITIIAF